MSEDGMIAGGGWAAERVVASSLIFGFDHLIQFLYPPSPSNVHHSF
jgi:hypothetical protein